jgi:hypothetical protein
MKSQKTIYYHKDRRVCILRHKNANGITKNIIVKNQTAKHNTLRTSRQEAAFKLTA